MASVSLCVLLYGLVALTYSQYAPMMGGMQGPMGGQAGYGGMAGNRRAGPGMGGFLTCINKDAQDPTSQIRLTLTRSRSMMMSSPRRGYAGFGGYGDMDDMDDMFGSPFGGMGGPGMAMMSMDDDDEDDDEAEFRIDGTIVPGMGGAKAGSYRVVLATFGRTSDGCSAQSLGPVFMGSPKRIRTGGMGGMGMMGGMGGFGGLMGLGGGAGMMGHGFGMGAGLLGGMGHRFGPGSRGPMGNNFWQGSMMGGHKGPIGVLRNPAIVGASATVFSDHIEGVSTDDLLGRSIALCKDVQNGQCVGGVPYCCTISRDNLPAMEVSVRPNMNRMHGGAGMGAMGGAMMGGGMPMGMGGHPGMGSAMIGGGIDTDGGDGISDNMGGGLF